MMDTRHMTTGEADAFRAGQRSGQAFARERHMLALTHLRAAIETGDLKAVRKAYSVLGGVGACAGSKGAGDPARAPHGACEPDGWITLEYRR